MRRLKTFTVSTRVTQPMFKGIQTVLEINAHINTADYVRDLIRRDLEDRGIEIEEHPR